MKLHEIYSIVSLPILLYEQHYHAQAKEKEYREVLDSCSLMPRLFLPDFQYCFAIRSSVTQVDRITSSLLYVRDLYVIFGDLRQCQLYFVSCYLSDLPSLCQLLLLDQLWQDASLYPRYDSGYPDFVASESYYLS